MKHWIKYRFREAMELRSALPSYNDCSITGRLGLDISNILKKSLHKQYNSIIVKLNYKNGGIDKDFISKFTAPPLPKKLTCGFMPKMIMIYKNKED